MSLVPTGGDLLAGLIDAGSKTEAVMYDANSNTILLQRGLSPFIQQLGIVSGIAQAIDAQKFGYLQMSKVRDDDARFALDAIFRGSASLVVNSYLSRLSLGPKTPTSDLFGISAPTSADQQPQIPTYYMTLEWVPAVVGSEFIAGSRERRLFALCPAETDRALQHAVTDSVQLFRPAAYWGSADEPSHPKPTLKKAPPGLDNAWSAETTSLGYFPIYALQTLGEQREQAPVESWMDPSSFTSDRLYLYTKETTVVGIWLTQWASDLAARDFNNYITARTAQLQSGLYSIVLGSRVAIVSGRGNEDAQKIATWALKQTQLEPNTMKGKSQ